MTISAESSSYRPTLVFENTRSHAIEFALEPEGWVWDMPPGSRFELLLDRPLAKSPAFFVDLQDDAISVYDEEAAVLKVKRDGELLLDYTPRPVLAGKR